MGMKFTITQVTKICDRSRNEIVRWINSGWLKAEKLNSDSRNSLYYINEEDLRAFMSSDHYTGHPKDIKASRPFTRVPNIEDCYPINLAARVMGVKLDDDSDEMPYDIWKIDFVRLKELVTHLTDKEQKVIDLRFRIGMTLDECAAAMGYKSREHIRVLETHGLRKLRTAINHEQCFMVSKKKYDNALKLIDYLNDKINKIYIQEGVLPNEEDKKEELLKRLDDITTMMNKVPFVI